MCRRCPAGDGIASVRGEAERQPGQAAIGIIERGQQANAVDQVTHAYRSDGYVGGGFAAMRQAKHGSERARRQDGSDAEGHRAGTERRNQHT